jgi:hypothetical protein
MNALDRLLTLVAIVAVSTATLPGLWPLLSPRADLWKVPGYVRQIDRLLGEADEMDARYALLHRMRAAREQVIEALCQSRLTAGQAVDRFRELDEVCSESGLPVAPERRNHSSSEVARMEVLGWLRPVLETTPSTRVRASLDRVVRELNGSTKGGDRGGRVQ